MIEELKLLLETLASVPSLAMWVAIGYLFYRIFIWGSVVLAIATGWKLAVQSFQYWVEKRSAIATQLEAEKTRQSELYLEAQKVEKTPPDQQLKVGRISISGCEDELMRQIRRIRGKGLSGDSKYIHGDSVDWLAEAIDAKEDLEREAKGK